MLEAVRVQLSAIHQERFLRQYSNSEFRKDLIVYTYENREMILPVLFEAIANNANIPGDVGESFVRWLTRCVILREFFFNFFQLFQFVSQFVSQIVFFLAECQGMRHGATSLWLC